MFRQKAAFSPYKTGNVRTNVASRSVRATLVTVERERVLHSRNTQISNFAKIRSLGPELFHADRDADGRTGGQTQTDLTKLIVSFRSFTNAPKN